MATTNIQSFAGQVEVNSNLTVNTNTLHVDSVAGRVGIGKTDPSYAMDVNGTVNATALYVDGSEFSGSPWTESGSNIYYTGGNVGIGTTAPQKTLEVAGPMRITDGGTNVSDLSVVGGTNDWEFQSKITAPDGAAEDLFGSSVSISGNGSYAIVGARQDAAVRSGNGLLYSLAGSAYIWVRSGSSWTFQQRITAPDAASTDYFGNSISISSDGSYALVGAYSKAIPTSAGGAAYIFSRSGTSWTFQQRITAPAPDIGPSDSFGISVSISGDGSRALVGAIGDDDGVSNSGAAYIFSRSGTTWSLQSKIKAPDPGPSDRFGRSVAISSDGSYALVGAYQDDQPYPSIPDQGSAYIFSRSGTSWSYQSKIWAPDRGPGEKFGVSASISSDGTYALVGAHLDNGYGAAYIFSRTGTTWGYRSKLRAPSPAGQDRFGYSVAISGDGSKALVGAYMVDGPTYDIGAVYMFSRSSGGWSFQSKFTAPDPTSGARLGYSVSIASSGNEYYAISGSYSHNSGRGSAYTYNLPVDALTVSTPIVADTSLLSFTGQHICFPEGPMDQGLVVSANKNKYVSLNGSLTTGTHAIKSSEALPVVSLSNVANDRSVFGVVDHFEQSGTTRSQTYGATVIRQDKESGDNRVIVNSLGEGAIWVANTNGNVVSGDFLTTSHLPGYAQRQSEDFRCNYTVAKSTMDCDFEPEELPVQVILKDNDDNNVLDSYGRLQWVDSDHTEPEYRIRYLDVSGTPTDEANAVHKAAYVGCTYHCG